MTMISIIIPAYNVEKYIGKTLESTLNQSYQDYEVIVVNDGSKDATGKICDELAQANEKLKVIHQENGGVMAARMKGLESSHGDWITFLDGDDMLPKDSLSSFSKYIEVENVDLILGTVLRFKENGKLVCVQSPVCLGQYSHDRYQKTICKNPRGLHGILYKRTILKGIKNIDRKIVNHEDFLYNILISAKIHSVIGIRDVTHHYIHHPGSVSKRQYDGTYWAYFMNYIKFLPTQGISYDNYMLFALKVVSMIIRVRECGWYMNYYDSSFSDIRDSHYKWYYGFRGNISIFFVNHPNKFILRILRIHLLEMIKRINSK